VSSPTFGKVQFGLPSGALVQNAVGTGDDFGTGLFFSWYNPGTIWVMADAPDNYITQQKVVYTTPEFSGFKAAISWEPTAVSMNYSDALTIGQDPTCLAGGSCGLLSKNRVELAAKYTGTFGAVGVKANGGYVFSDAEKAGDTKVAQSVSYGNVGLEFHLAGFELEGSVNPGKFNVNAVDNGNPDGPLPLGAKGSTAWIVGGGYGAGPFKVGAVYYDVSYDEGDLGGPLGKTGHMGGEGLGGSYSVGPGVVLYVDAINANIDEFNYTATSFGKQHPMSLGVGTFFTW
jgi:predicted porin